MEAHNAEDLAWANMSYSDRFFWYLDNKILKNTSNQRDPKIASDVTEKLETSNNDAESPTEPVSETPLEPSPETVVEQIVEQIVEPVAVVEAEHKNEFKKRSKGKKISIEM